MEESVTQTTPTPASAPETSAAPSSLVPEGQDWEAFFRAAISLGARLNPERTTARANCPCHDDRERALLLALEDGKFRFECKAGCSQEAIAAEFVRRGVFAPPKPTEPPATTEPSKPPVGPEPANVASRPANDAQPFLDVLPGKIPLALWPGWIPGSELTLIEGDPGDGKAAASVSILADLSNGRIPGSDEACPPVLIACFCTKDPDGIVLSKLLAAGANRENLLFPAWRDRKDLCAWAPILNAQNVKIAYLDLLPHFVGNAWRDEEEFDQRLAKVIAAFRESGIAILACPGIVKAPIRRASRNRAQSVITIAKENDARYSVRSSQCDSPRTLAGVIAEKSTEWGRIGVWEWVEDLGGRTWKSRKERNKAIGQEVIEILESNGGEMLHADIQKQLGLPQKQLSDLRSQHLLGIVDSQKAGRFGWRWTLNRRKPEGHLACAGS